MFSPRLACMIAAGAVGVACADQVSLVPEKDNTIYEDGGDVSNGQGAYIFTGMNGTFLARRALLYFNVQGNIPPGATINSVTLRMFMSRTISAAQEVSLHRVLADWGEGASDAFGDEGFGTAAEPGDATWTHRFFDTDTWDVPGGDYDGTSSAAASVVFDDFYEWSGPGLVADVQAWIDQQGNNFGWIVIGNEAESATAKRFDSAENADPTHWPTLIVDFTVGCKLDCDGDGICDESEKDCDQDGVPDDCDDSVCAADLAPPFDVLNIFDFLAFQTLYSDQDPCADVAAPIGVWNVFDFLAFQTSYGNGC